MRVGGDVGATVGARVGAPVGGTTQLVVPFVDGTSPARHSHVYDEFPSGTATQKVVLTSQLCTPGVHGS